MENTDFQIQETQYTLCGTTKKNASKQISVKPLKKVKLDGGKMTHFIWETLVPVIFNYLPEITIPEEQSNDKFSVVIKNLFTQKFVSRENILHK